MDQNEMMESASPLWIIQAEGNQTGQAACATHLIDSLRERENGTHYATLI